MYKQVDSKSFSIFSHNIRSLSGHFESLKDCIYSMLPATFSIIALQEVWSIYKTFELTGYSNIIFKTRDMNKERNPNCGGGVGFFVNSKLEFEVLEEESIFIEGVYESLWIKVEVAKNIHKIIGNIYRPIILFTILVLLDLKRHKLLKFSFILQEKVEFKII